MILPSLPFTDFLKDERRPLEKVAAAATRYISGSNLVFVTLLRRYFGLFSAWKIKNRIHNCATVGINPHSEEWGILVNYIHSRGRKVGDFDIKSMDASNAAEMIYIVLHGGPYRWMCENANPTPRQKTIMLGLIYMLMWSEHIKGKYVYRWRGANSSGNFLTVIINDEAIAVLFISAFGELHPKGLSAMPTWHDFIALCTHGDDNMEGIAESITSWFTPKAVAEVFLKYGYTLTSSDKKALGTEWKRIEDAQFLKRGFTFNERLHQWTAPLVLDTVLEAPMWTKKDPNQILYAVETFDTMVKELSLHPPEVFNEWAPKMFAAFTKAYGHPHHTTDQLALQDATRNLALYCGPDDGRHAYIQGLMSDLTGSNGDYCCQIITKKRRSKFTPGQGLLPLAYRHSLQAITPAPEWLAKLGARSPIQGYFSFADPTGWEKRKGPGIGSSLHPAADRRGRIADSDKTTTTPVSNDSSLTVINTGKDTIQPVPVAPMAPTIPVGPSTINKNEGILDFLSRPILVDQGTITTATTGTFYNLVIPDAYFSQNLVARKLEGFQGIRGTMVVRLLVSGQSGQQGIVGMYYVPQAVVSGFLVSIRTADNVHASQLPRAECYIGSEDGCEMIIPFVGPNLYHSLMSGAGDWGVVYIRMYSDLKVGTGSNSCNFSIYVNMLPETIELFNPTYNLSPFPMLGSRGKVFHGEQKGDHCSSKAPMRKKRTPPSDKEAAASGEGKITKALSTASSVATVAGLAIPELLPIAEVAAWALGVSAKLTSYFGWSKPRNESPTTIVHDIANRYGQNFDGVSIACSLGASSQNKVDVIPGFAGNNIDEHALDYLLTKYTWLSVTSLDDTAPAGAVTYTKPLRPNAMKITNAGPPVNFSGGPVGYMADMFQMYHGNFKMRMRISKTPYHEGRLAVVFYPGLTSPPSYDLSAYANQDIIDLSEGMEWEFTFPYCSQQYYLPIDTAYGVVAVYVVNPIVAPSIASNTIQINYEWAADAGFEYAFPRATQMSVYSPTVTSVEEDHEGNADHCVMAAGFQKKKIMTTIGASKTSDQDVDYARACIGEKIMSIKQLLLMRQRPIVNGIGTVAGSYYRFRPFTIGIAKGDTIATDWADFSGDYISLFAPCFAYSRGGVEIGFSVPQAGGQLMMSYITPNYDNILEPASKTTSPPTNYNACRSPELGPLTGVVYCPQYGYNVSRLNRVSLAIGNTGTFEPNDQWSSPVILWLETSIVKTPLVWRNAADDYQLGCFLGVPNWIIGTNSNDPAPAPSQDVTLPVSSSIPSNAVAPHATGFTTHGTKPHGPQANRITEVAQKRFP